MPGKGKKSKAQRKHVIGQNASRKLSEAVSGTRSVTTGYNVPPRNFLHTQIAGVPQTMRQTLASFIVGISSGSTVGVLNTTLKIVMNNPYDPDFAVGGSSATGFAKLMAFYTKCFCVGARAKIKVQADNGGNNFMFIHTAQLSTLSTTSTGITETITAGLVDWKVTSDSPDHAELNMAVDVGKFLHKPKVLDDPDLFCTSSAGPNEAVYLHLGFYPNFTAGSYLQCYAAEIEFDCWFTDPKPFT